jgi:hypothetical protein
MTFATPETRSPPMRGANLRELMDRMGHSTTRPALIYLHSTDERQRTIADLIDKRTRTKLRKIKNPGKSKSQSGTDLARRRTPASYRLIGNLPKPGLTWAGR